MRVVMLVKMSGTRNGEDWPAPGQPFDVTEDEAASLIHHRMAEEYVPPVESAAMNTKAEKR